jgi:TatD related DNase
MNGTPLASGVDFHCHLDLYPDHAAAIAQAEAAGVYTLTVTTTPKAWPRNRELTDGTRYVRAALGLHPQLVAERAGELPLWERYLSETWSRCRATLLQIAGHPEAGVPGRVGALRRSRGENPDGPQRAQCGGGARHDRSAPACLARHRGPALVHRRQEPGTHSAEGVESR